MIAILGGRGFLKNLALILQQKDEVYIGFLKYALIPNVRVWGLSEVRGDGIGAALLTAL